MEKTLTTIRALKIALPILFVGFLVLIVSFYSSRNVPDATQETPAARPEREGEQARLISYEFEDTQTVGDRVISRIRAARTVGFESGWYTLDRAELVIFRENGGVYTLTAPSVEFNAETKEARAEGGVIVTSDDGLDLRTESIVFDGSRLTNNVPVRFRMNHWSGTARGADLDVEREVLHLDDGVEVSFASETGTAIDLTSRTATFERLTGIARFDEDVRLVRLGDTYQSASMATQVDQSHRQMIALGGEGDVVVNLAPGSDVVKMDGELARGQKRITAERFEGEFDGDGRMTAVELFSGQSPVVVKLSGAVPRTTQARSAKVSLGEGGAESLTLFGNVRLDEQGPERRSMRSERLVVTFHPTTGDATSAVFDGNIRYKDVTNEARSERIFYDLREGTVRMSSLPGSAPTITSGPQRISADEIIVEPDGKVLRASGSVITRIVSEQGGRTAAETSLFPAEGAIFVNSDVLAIREQEGFAAFSGGVKAWQGNNTLFADDLQILSHGESITAKGNVRTILPNTENPQGEPVRSRSDRLEAKRTERQIELIDDVRIESEGRSLKGQRALFVFSPQQELDRVVATGNVEVREISTGRVGKGERAVYELAEETVLIQGKPAEIQEPRGTIKGNQIVLDMKRNRVDVLQGDSPTEATYNAEAGEQ